MTSSYVNGVTTTYAYRADGLRKSKTVNGVITRHVWDGDQIVQDRTGWYTTTEYVRGIRLIDTFTYGDYARFTYIQNARGDVVGFVDGLTSIADTVDYDGFGTYESYTPTNPLGYCGEYRDAETGFIYLRARYYDPSIGRFTTEDPARDGLNWYVYCNNNPIAFVDPWGLWMEGDEDLPEEIQILLNGEAMDGSGGLTLAWELANQRGDEIAKKRIAEEASQIRSFATSSINRIVILVQSAGASGAGHTATMMLNAENQGILLSYYSQNGSALGPGEMRVAAYEAGAWENVLNKSVYLSSSNGFERMETYSGKIVVSLDQQEGLRALRKMAIFYNNAGTYNLALNNCDHITYRVVTAAGKFYDKQILPNDSFARTKLYYENRLAWILLNTFEMR